VKTARAWYAQKLSGLALSDNADGVAQPREGVGFPLQKLGRRTDSSCRRRARAMPIRDLVHLAGADLQFDR